MGLHCIGCFNALLGSDIGIYCFEKEKETTGRNVICCSVNIEQYRLSYIDNRLCCVCSVAINYSNNANPSYVSTVAEALVVCLDV